MILPELDFINAHSKKVFLKLEFQVSLLPHELSEKDMNRMPKFPKFHAFVWYSSVQPHHIDGISLPTHTF